MERSEVNILIVTPDPAVVSETIGFCQDERFALNIDHVSSVQKISGKNFDTCDIICCSEKAKKAIQQIFKIRDYMLFWVTIPEPSHPENDRSPEYVFQYFDDNKRLEFLGVLEQVRRVKQDEGQRLYDCERNARDQMILSVHHNVNNALFPIFSSLTKLTRELGDCPDEKLMQHIRMIEKNAAKIKKFVSELK